MGALKPLAAEIADMFKRLPSRGVAFLLLLAASTTHPARAELTEADFFSDVPVVLTTTRLAQSLFETPGAGGEFLGAACACRGHFGPVHHPGGRGGAD